MDEQQREHHLFQTCLAIGMLLGFVVGCLLNR